MTQVPVARCQYCGSQDIGGGGNMGHFPMSWATGKPAEIPNLSALQDGAGSVSAWRNPAVSRRQSRADTMEHQIIMKRKAENSHISQAPVAILSLRRNGNEAHSGNSRCGLRCFRLSCTISICKVEGDSLLCQNKDSQGIRFRDMPSTSSWRRRAKPPWKSISGTFGRSLLGRTGRRSARS